MDTEIGSYCLTLGRMVTQREQGTQSEWHSQMRCECENILEGEIHEQNILVTNTVLIQCHGVKRAWALGSCWLH